MNAQISTIQRILRSSRLSVVRDFYRNYYTLPRLHRRFGAMNLRDAFATIYREGYWNSGQLTPFDSGTGSASANATIYCELIRCFISEHQVQAVVDLGCGDFRVGKEIAACGVNYVGVDIVPELIAHLRNDFEDQRVKFECIDATVDFLPHGDLVLVRQVLQHLTNRQIQLVVERFSQFKYAIVTESIALGKDVIPNRDKIHGPDIRLYSNSGVFLDKPPFNLAVEELLRIPVNKHEAIVTTLIRWPHSARP
jgi:SAM-dependent methyltransferase